MTGALTAAVEPAGIGSERDEFLCEAVAGLMRRPRMLPGKFLWDEAGSLLFDRICASPDYYSTRSEAALMPDALRGVAAVVGPGATIVEFGSGASRKVRALLDTLERPARYVAVDISRDYLQASVARLAPDYPDVAMTAVCADYSRPIRLPIDRAGGPVLGFFPGTTIGNFAPDGAREFLARARTALGGGRFLVGADPNREEALLRRAYGGCDGLMAAFHLNLLTRLERDLGAEVDAGAFRHEVRVLPDPFRVEAHLVAARATTLRLDGRAFAFEPGEGFRTDVSHKYDPPTFRALAETAGWRHDRVWVAADDLFSLHLLTT